jgi:predicted permease
MALGIAATTVLSTVAYSVLMKPLPWAGAPRLVRLYETRQGSTRRFGPMMTNGSYRMWLESMAMLDGIGAWSGEQVTLTGMGDPERIRIGRVTPGLFPLLGVAPSLGHGFTGGDEEPGKPPIAILSYALWQRHFGGNPAAIGQTVRFDGTAYTVVGVMPASFAFPDRVTQLWVPFYIPPIEVSQDGHGVSISMFQAIGRLKPGATPEQAASEGTARARLGPEPGVVAIAVFGSRGLIDVSAVPMLDALTADVRTPILILLGAVGLLLITATANVANLQLARATARRRELAIRSALGAGSGRLVRQCLAENVLLGMLGGLAGVALAAWAARALPSLVPADFPRVDDLGLHIRVLIFAIGVSIVAGLAFGVLPALQASRTDLVPALVEDSQAPVGGGWRSRTARTRGLIMAAQVAIAFVLLVGAALLIRSFMGLLGADIGYDRANVVMAKLSLEEGYTPERRLQALDRITERLTALPDVTRATFGNVIPFTGGSKLSSFPLKQRDGNTVQVQTGSRSIGPGYFAALGQRVVEGREFTRADTALAEPVAMVNREFSRKYLEGRALGWVLPGDTVNYSIVGVVDNAARQTVTDAPQPEIYFSQLQRPIANADMAIVVRSTGDPKRLVPTLRAIVKQEDPNVPVESVVTLEDLVSNSLARPHLYAVLLGTFALFAAAIAGVGLFGLLSYTVAQRAREIGVRAALGARPSAIVGMIVWQSVRIAAVGIVAGVIVALWASGSLRKFLYGLTPQDPVTFATVAVLLIVVAALASFVPARRAARVDPVRVLRA